MFRKVRRIGREMATTAFNCCFNRPYGTVLMLHRIGPAEQDRLRCLGDLNVTVDRLQRFVDERRKTHDFISLDEVKERMEDPSKRKRPFVAFTIDDGYRDNLTYGLPFFERNNIPFAVFLTVDFINRHPAFNFPFLIERMVRDNGKMEVGGICFDCPDQEQKNETFRHLKAMSLNCGYNSFEKRFNALFSNYLKKDYYEDLTMTWDEVRQLAASGLCTIGSHTMTHFRLGNLTESELEYELGESKKQIEEHIDSEVKYVSYPFGWMTDVNQEVFNVTRECGYKMGLMAQGGEIRRMDTDLFNVKRQKLLMNE